MGKKLLTSILLITCVIVTISGCTSNSSYTIANSTFNIPNNFQKGNLTSYDDPTYAYMSEMTFKLNGIEVLGVDVYPNAIEYTKGMKDPLFYPTSQFEPATKIYTTNIGSTQLTVLQDGNTNLKNYFFIKSGKYYSIETSTFGGNMGANNTNELDNAMNMIVETMK